MVYSAGHSGAVVPVLVLLFVALWFILGGDLFEAWPCVVLVLFFCPCGVAVASLGEGSGRGRAGLGTFRAFVRFVLVSVCLFSLPLGVYEEIRTKQDLSCISVCSLQILYKSKFILMATSFGTNAIVVTRVQCTRYFKKQDLMVNRNNNR